MDIKDFEKQILDEIKKVVVKIIHKYPELNISAKSRAGAEISDFLENKFVEETKNHKYLKKTESSPKGATKNPWDALTIFTIETHEEVVWIDFKAVKISGKDSNPDIGTPDKIIDLLNEGFFYLVYVFIYYEESKKGLKFAKNVDGDYIKIYFLKDISSTVRRNPKNQLQVNISAKPEERTREEFINLLYNKIEESHVRQIKNSEKVLKSLREKKIKNLLVEINKISEEKIKKIASETIEADEEVKKKLIDKIKKSEGKIKKI